MAPLPAARFLTGDSFATVRPVAAPLCVAHRGASDLAPENTLTAVRSAMTLGVDLVEVDVQRTRDRVLVLLHDLTLERTTNVREVYPDRAPWRVSDFTLAQLQRLDAGSRFSPAYGGETVPTLDDALSALRGSGSGLLLELKHPSSTPGVVAELSAELALHRRTAAGRALRLMVQSLDHQAMALLKAYDTAVDVGLLGKPPREKLPQLARWATAVNPHQYAVDGGYVAAVRETGMLCFPWTVNTNLTMRRALRMAADGIITDRPEQLMRLLRPVPPTGDPASGARRITRRRWAG